MVFLLIPEGIQEKVILQTATLKFHKKPPNIKGIQGLGHNFEVYRRLTSHQENQKQRILSLSFS